MACGEVTKSPVHLLIMNCTSTFSLSLSLSFTVLRLMTNQWWSPWHLNKQLTWVQALRGPNCLGEVSSSSCHIRCPLWESSIHPSIHRPRQSLRRPFLPHQPVWRVIALASVHDEGLRSQWGLCKNTQLPCPAPHLHLALDMVHSPSLTHSTSTDTQSLTHSYTHTLILRTGCTRVQVTDASAQDVPLQEVLASHAQCATGRICNVSACLSASPRVHWPDSVQKIAE